MPRAIGMFGHGLNPDYFINPPAFTYVVHVLFALRWGTDPATVGGAYAADPTAAFTIARAASATLGALAVAADRDRRRAAVRRPPRRRRSPARCSAVAFLPVHYSHFALNDAPTLAPLALAWSAWPASTAPAARASTCSPAPRSASRSRPSTRPGSCVVDDRRGGLRLAGRARAAAQPGDLRSALMCAGFLVANPYALLDHHAFLDGLRKQTETAGDEGGKLGLANSSRLDATTSATFTVGLRLAALAGRARRPRRADRPPPAARAHARARADPAVPLPRQPVALLRALDAARSTRCLPAGGLGAWSCSRSRFRPRWALPAAGGAACCLQGLVFSVHNDLVLAREDTRMVAREWMVADIPAGTKIVVEPIAPDQWATDVGHPCSATAAHGQRHPLEQVPHLALVLRQRRRAIRGAAAG